MNYLKDALVLVGFGSILTVAWFVFDYLKNRAIFKSNTAKTATAKATWHDTAMGLQVLQNVCQASINNADKLDATNADKRKQVASNMQAYADEHNLPVSTNYIQGTIANEVTNLRYKQSLIENNGESGNSNLTSVELKNNGVEKSE